jgi:hypothetical protein
VPDFKLIKPLGSNKSHYNAVAYNLAIKMKKNKGKDTSMSIQGTRWRLAPSFRPLCAPGLPLDLTCHHLHVHTFWCFVNSKMLGLSWCFASGAHSCKRTTILYNKLAICEITLDSKTCLLRTFQRIQLCAANNIQISRHGRPVKLETMAKNWAKEVGDQRRPRSCLTTLHINLAREQVKKMWLAVSAES